MAASYLAAPRLSKEEEDREKASLTDEERIAALRDLYGTLPIPTEELDTLRSKESALIGGETSSLEEAEEQKVNNKCLDELEEELATALASADSGDGDECVREFIAVGGGGNSQIRVSTSAYRQAQRRCPDIVNSRDHQLLFLRAEYFEAKAAATRLLRYWTDRVAMWEDLSFGPLLPLDSDSMEMSLGYPRLAPERDQSGRALIIFNQSVIKHNTYDRKGMLRACWCIMHEALQDVQVQKSGFVLIGLGYGQLDQLDRKLDTLLIKSIQDTLPVRIAASHLIYGSNKYTYELIAPNIKFFFGRMARARIREYTGSDADTLEQLKRYGIAASSMPSESGGGWSYNKRWFEEEKERAPEKEPPKE